MKVYIGAPIDTARPECSPAEQFAELAQLVKNGLGPEVAIYNPLAAFANSGDAVTCAPDLAYFQSVNSHALRNANIAVFIWNGSPTFGVPIEISECLGRGVPTIVLNTTGKKLGVYARLLARRIVESPEQLVAELQAFKAGGDLQAKEN